MSITFTPPVARDGCGASGRPLTRRSLSVIILRHSLFQPRRVCFVAEMLCSCCMSSKVSV